MNISKEKYKWIVSRLKNRNISLKTAMLFPDPKHLTLANLAIKEIEKRRNKNYSNVDYNKLIKNLSNTKQFIEMCELKMNNPDKYTRPALTFKRRTKLRKDLYRIENLRLLALKIRKKKSKNGLF